MGCHPSRVKNTHNDIHLIKNKEKMKRLFEEITTFLFGKRHYAIIIGERGSDRYYVASEIHATKSSAEAHRRRIEETRAYQYITTITFRWRR